MFILQLFERRFFERSHTAIEQSHSLGDLHLIFIAILKFVMLSRHPNVVEELATSFFGQYLLIV